MQEEVAPSQAALSVPERRWRSPTLCRLHQPAVDLNNRLCHRRSWEVDWFGVPAQVDVVGVQWIGDTVALPSHELLARLHWRGMTSYLGLSHVAVEAATEVGAEPMRAFLIKFSKPEQRAFFLQATQKMWPPEQAEKARDTDFLILLPAFVVGELTSAFEIGFLLYLPFVVIDLIVSNVLLALGMMMVSPSTISLPLKLFLFVMVDGWTRLLHGLVLSYV